MNSQVFKPPNCTPFFIPAQLKFQKQFSHINTVLRSVKVAPAKAGMTLGGYAEYLCVDTK